MSNREKWFLLIICLLLLVIMFSGEGFRKKNKLIEENKILISDYKERIYSNNLLIDSLDFELKNAKKTDTIIKIKYEQRIDSVYVYNYSDYISFYDTLLHTNIQKSDTFICFDSISVQKLTIKLVNCSLDSELLANCYIQNNLYTNIISVQDSVISLKDSILVNKDTEIANINTANNLKVKKLRKQRNSFVATTVVELAIIIGLITK